MTTGDRIGTGIVFGAIGGFIAGLPAMAFARWAGAPDDWLLPFGACVMFLGPFTGIVIALVGKSENA